MTEFLDVSIDQTLLILLFSFSLTLVIAGMLIYRFRFFDRKDNNRFYSAPKPSPSRIIGRMIIIIFGILTFVMLMVMIMSFAGM